MRPSNHLFLTAALGSIVSMLGLIWDARIHMFEHGSMAEPLINLSEPLATNPGHIVFGLGFLLTMLSCLAGFAGTWIQLHQQQPSRPSWQALALPLALALLTGATGFMAVYFLGQTG